MAGLLGAFLVAGCGRTELVTEARELRLDAGTPVPLADSGVTSAFTRAPPGCGVTADPLVASVLGPGFQSDPGSGASRTITVTFSCRISRVAVTALDTDFSVTTLVAFDVLGNELARVDFPFDSRPGVLTRDRREVRAANIARVELRPAAADLVAWDELVAD